MSLKHIVVKPLITEKTLAQTQKGVFTFAVDKNATKTQIARAIEDYFAVTVTSVRTTTKPSREYRSGRRRLLRIVGAGKKAQVTLKPGQKIDLFEIEHS